MKLKYIFTSLVAVCALAIGCTKTNPTELENIKVSQSVIGFTGAKADSVYVTINALEKWTISTLAKADSAWLAVSPMSGEAGETKVKFKTLAATNACNKTTLKIKCGANTQYLVIQQGVPEVKEVTCAEVLAGSNGATYRVTGTVKSIVDAEVYGNWYIMDETGEVYVYGTKNADGESKKGALKSYGIGVGDIVTIEGPRAEYKGTIELADVTVLKIVKSLVEVCNKDALTDIDKAGADVDMKVIAKGGNLNIKTINPADSTELDWVSLRGTDTKKAVKSSDPDTTIVKVRIDSSWVDARSGIISFTSGTSTVEVTVSQKSGLAAYTLPYTETFDGSLGEWTINDVANPDSIKAWSSNTGYAKASGFISSANHEVVSELVSPLIDLSKETAASITFEHAAKFGNILDDEFTLWVSKDNGATYTQILIPVYSDKTTWNYVSNSVSLTPYVGKLINIKFVYKSYTTGGPTIRLKNVNIKAEEITITNLAQLSSTVATSDKVNFTSTLTDAIVTYVNGSNAFISDSTASVQLYKSGHGLVAGQRINGTVTGKVCLYGGFTELTDIDLTSATVTTEPAPDPVVITLDSLKKVYRRNLNNLVKIENATFDAAAAGTGKVNSNLSQGTVSLPTRTQVASIAYSAAPQEYDVVCIPTLYQLSPQLAIYEAPTAKID